MSLSELRKRNLGGFGSSYIRRPLHERHGSEPVSVGSRTLPSGPTNLSSSPYNSAFRRVTPRRSHPESDPERLTDLMDLSRFRDSGELSDITVSVDGREFRLHKFPLYTRSDFFRALARADSERVVLDQFPGGAETFEAVANFCYNKRVDVDRENVCRLRCAAEFLQMSNPGNLAELADRFLLDLLTTAKLSHDAGVVVDLLLDCRDLGPIAEQAKIVCRCLQAIVDCWLLTSKWTRRLPPDGAAADGAGFRRVCRLPLDWFRQLLLAARERNVRAGVLANVVQMYIVERIQKRSSKEAADTGRDEEKERSEEGDGMPPEADPENETDERKCADNREADEKIQEIQEDDEKDVVKEEVGSAGSDNPEESDDDVPDDADIGIVMDTLLLELPDSAALADTFVPKWTVEMLALADDLQCRCRDLLLRIAARLLYRLAPADWSRITPDLLEQVIQEAAKNPAHLDPDTVCSVVDGYLLDLAEKEKLGAEVFKKLANCIPKAQRQSHDTLFKVLEKLLKSDKLQISDSDKEAMLETVDFRRLSESALQHAFDSKLVPDPYVTRAALALCARLRAELETARDIIKSQEDELDRFGLSGGRASSWLHDIETDFGLTTPIAVPEVSAYRHESCPPSSFRDEPEDPYKHSPAGHDPILEKALGGRYFDDPFDVDSTYPWYKCTRRSYYDDVTYPKTTHTQYRRAYEPLPSRSTHYRSFHW